MKFAINEFDNHEIREAPRLKNFKKISFKLIKTELLINKNYQCPNS
jgi:hypothetical protein